MDAVIDCQVTGDEPESPYSEVKLNFLKRMINEITDNKDMFYWLDKCFQAKGWQIHNVINNYNEWSKIACLAENP